MFRKIVYFNVLLASVSFAELLYVPQEYPTIQDAINVSVNNDTVLVSPGYYAENINFNGKAITVSSLYIFGQDSSIIGTTIIDAQNEGSVATFSNGEESTSILQGFTMQNGGGNNEDPDGNGTFYTYGGGVYCENSNPIIKDCIIRDNVADEGGGGGIFCYQASPTFIGCTIFGNERARLGSRY